MNQRLNELTDMPANAEAEKIAWYGHDTIIIPATSGGDGTAILKSASLFDKTENKKKILKTNDFPLTSGRIARILGLRVTHNLNFVDKSKLLAFEEFSYLGFKIEDKDYSNLPIFDLLPYNRVRNGATSNYRELLSTIPNVATDPVAPETNEIWYNTTSGLLKMKTATVVVVIPHDVAESYNVLALNGKFKALSTPIDPPHDGKIEMSFEPGLADAVLSNVATFGDKFGAGVVDSANTPVYWIKVAWFGQLIRKTR